MLTCLEVSRVKFLVLVRWHIGMTEEITLASDRSSLIASQAVCTASWKSSTADDLRGLSGWHVEQEGTKWQNVSKRHDTSTIPCNASLIPCSQDTATRQFYILPFEVQPSGRSGANSFARIWLLLHSQRFEDLSSVDGCVILAIW